MAVARRFGLKWLGVVLGVILTTAASVSTASPPLRDDVFYEIFVRSFQDSNGDGIGDLNGITSRLDYLKGLGIHGVWLTPIFASPSYHGYDATDYKTIEPEYGTLADFDRLINEAHRRGIKVVLDIAINHTSNQHPWFVSASVAPDSPFRDYYVWRSSKPAWGEWIPLGDEFYYTVFGAHMPNLNWTNAKVRAEVRGILEYWLKRGVDGFRLDAARYYVPGPKGESDTPETHRAIAEFAQAMRALYPNAFFVGEIWADAETIGSYGNGKELDLAFSFPTAFGVIESLKQESGTPLLQETRNILKSYRDQGFSAPFITNHDMDRAISQLDGDVRKMKLAASWLMTMPGTPFLYYGEEIGLPNGRGEDFDGDYAKRVPMQWNAEKGAGFTAGDAEPWLPLVGNAKFVSVASQESDPDSLLNAYRKLVALRNDTPALRQGELMGVAAGSSSAVLSWQRKLAGHRVVMVANFGKTLAPPQHVAIPAKADLPPFARIQVRTLLGKGQARVRSKAHGALELETPAIRPFEILIVSLD